MAVLMLRDLNDRHLVEVVLHEDEAQIEIDVLEHLEHLLGRSDLRGQVETSS